MKNTETMINNTNVVHGEFQRSFLARAVDQIKIWNERRIALRQLHSLSDRMLNDIGISRFEISETVNNPGSFAHNLVQRTSRPEVSAEIRRAA